MRILRRVGLISGAETADLPATTSVCRTYVMGGRKFEWEDCT